MDTLMRTKKLEVLGFERPQAEGLVLMVQESIDHEVAKKIDLDQVKTSLNAKIDKVEASLNAKIDKVEASLRSEFKVLHKDLLIQLGGLMITVAGIMVGVLIGVLK